MDIGGGIDSTVGLFGSIAAATSPLALCERVSYIIIYKYKFNNVVLIMTNTNICVLRFHFSILEFEFLLEFVLTLHFSCIYTFF